MAGWLLIKRTMQSWHNVIYVLYPILKLICYVSHVGNGCRSRIGSAQARKVVSSIPDWVKQMIYRMYTCRFLAMHSELLG